MTEEEKRAARAPIRGLASGPATHGAPVPPPPRRTSAVSPPADAKPTVKALYDFESDEAGDLPFSEGAVIELLEKPSADWWKGRLNGREGLFPRNYVQEQ